jgi:hypothetical protein
VRMCNYFNQISKRLVQPYWGKVILNKLICLEQGKNRLV